MREVGQMNVGVQQWYDERMETERPIMHHVVTHDYYRVQTESGKRQWLAVPAGTPTKLVTTPERARPVARLAAAA
jgi:hypothetical protein